ncbi:MOS1T transposase, partial [Pseudoatta argentina]
MIQKQGHWVSYELKPRDVERRFGTCELLLQRQKRKGFLSLSTLIDAFESSLKRKTAAIRAMTYTLTAQDVQDHPECVPRHPTDILKTFIPLLDILRSSLGHYFRDILRMSLWDNLRRNCRESYGDIAIGYVQLKRERDLCTVKCRVYFEHKVPGTTAGGAAVLVRSNIKFLQRALFFFGQYSLLYTRRFPLNNVKTEKVIQLSLKTRYLLWKAKKPKVNTSPIRKPDDSWVRNNQDDLHADYLEQVFK